MSTTLSYVGDPHALLSAVCELIDEAREGLVLQMYLFAHNGDQTLLLPRDGAFPYAATVAERLATKARSHPTMPIVVVLDTNTPADSARTRRKGKLVRDALREAGVGVLDANLFGTRFRRERSWLPAKNLHLARTPRADWVARQNRWQALHNVEDHRKNLVIDGGRAGAVTSHNFFDPAFDWHENLFWLEGPPARALWRSATLAVRAALELPHVSERDRAIAERLLALPEATSWSPVWGRHAPVEGFPLAVGSQGPVASGQGTLRVVEHEAIRPALASLVQGAGPGDELLVASAYFSDVSVLDELGAAALRGVRVRVLLDSLHALPLPPLAAWLTRTLVNHAVLARARRWARRTGRFELRVHASQSGPMMHLKTVARLGTNPQLLGGQANMTPRSFGGAWLETDVETSCPVVVDGFAAHFDRLWALPCVHPLDSWPRPLGAAGDAFRSLALWLFARLGLEP